MGLQGIQDLKETPDLRGPLDRPDPQGQLELPDRLGLLDLLALKERL